MSFYIDKDAQGHFEHIRRYLPKASYHVHFELGKGSLNYVVEFGDYGAGTWCDFKATLREGESLAIMAVTGELYAKGEKVPSVAPESNFSCIDDDFDYGEWDDEEYPDNVQVTTTQCCPPWAAAMVIAWAQGEVAEEQGDIVY